MSQQILATFSGKDHPGITSEVTGILARHKVAIIDIAQAVIQNLLSLSICFELPDGELGKKILQELQTLSTEQGLDLEHRALGKPGSQDAKTGHSGELYHYAVTLIADVVTAEALHQVTTTLAKRKTNIDVIKRLSADGFSCVEMIVSSPEEFSIKSKNAVKKELLGIAKKLGVDIALQSEGLYRRAKRLVVLDMDSTLIQGEVINELARLKGVFDEVSAITHAAMNGKMDYDESLRQRVRMLKGMTSAELEQVFQKIELTPGAADLISVLKKLGYKLALISGGFTYVAERLKNQLGIDFVYANHLEIKDGALTGNVIPPIVNAQRKADLLDVIAQQEKIELDQVIAIGDGANDLLMLEKAGLGIAFNAKPTVREKADLSLGQKNLRSVLYLLGLSERELSVCFKAHSRV
jgi:phosphoserine phosphatase